MKRIVTGYQMKALDAYTIETMGVPSLVLMERAALAVTDEILSGDYSLDRILVVCGTGNNGGDGVAVARILHLKGYKVAIFAAGNPDRYSDGMKVQMKIAQNYHVDFVTKPDYHEYTVIVDAIFGVGLARPVKGNYLKIINRLNLSAIPVVAVDIPSGLHSDTGAVMGAAIRATATITFAFSKPGLLMGHGQTHAGKVITADIGIYETKVMQGEEPEIVLYQTEEEDLFQLPRREETG
ncbi:MAG TPA: NAD(P)H-hydrate epimerase, partial [Candidatus Pelethocola excrementipullorum]|nr:NAD(P)H-hydrate epimerase [Candidatus Pelethocola excrementipullorum]